MRQPKRQLAARWYVREPHGEAVSCESLVNKSTLRVIEAFSKSTDPSCLDTAVPAPESRGVQSRDEMCGISKPEADGRRHRYERGTSHTPAIERISGAKSSRFTLTT